jgi:hypothetical protein
MPDTIIVTAAEGREVPLHRDDYAAPGGGHSILKPGEEVELVASAAIRRKLRCGDLLEVKPAAPAKTPMKLPGVSPAKEG